MIESPNGDKSSLFGSPCKEGYDSHYVLVKKVVEFSQENYLPCKYDDPVGPDYDELVVFNPDQILPRFLCYYEADQTSISEKIIFWYSYKISIQIV